MVHRLSQVLTIQELSEYLKVPKSISYRLVREGKHSTLKVWRFQL
jgi:excisionase family DNA binding protein